MKNLFLSAVLLLTAPQKSTIDFLRQYNGKYSFDVNLFNNAVLKQRLTKLLGVPQFTFLTKKVWQTAGPIKVENGFFYEWAMQEHSGGDPAATLLADIKNNILYVVIVKDKLRTVYAEDGSGALPQALDDWAKKQSAQ